MLAQSRTTKSDDISFRVFFNGGGLLVAELKQRGDDVYVIILVLRDAKVNFASMLRCD